MPQGLCKSFSEGSDKQPTLFVNLKNLWTVVLYRAEQGAPLLWIELCSAWCWINGSHLHPEGSLITVLFELTSLYFLNRLNWYKFVSYTARKWLCTFWTSEKLCVWVNLWKIKTSAQNVLYLGSTFETSHRATHFWRRLRLRALFNLQNYFISFLWSFYKIDMTLLKQTHTHTTGCVFPHGCLCPPMGSNNLLPAER